MGGSEAATGPHDGATHRARGSFDDRPAPDTNRPRTEVSTAICPQSVPGLLHPPAGRPLPRAPLLATPVARSSAVGTLQRKIFVDPGAEAIVEAELPKQFNQLTPTQKFVLRKLIEDDVTEQRRLADHSALIRRVAELASVYDKIPKPRRSDADLDLMHTMISLSDEGPNSAVHKQHAENSARTMLLNGENWIKADQNMRVSQGKHEGPEDGGSGPATTMEKIATADSDALTDEPLMREFKKASADPLKQEFAAQHALQAVSSQNLARLSNEAVSLGIKADPAAKMKLNQLAGSFLSLTHFNQSDEMRFVVRYPAPAPPGNIMTLFSRKLLDEQSERLGVADYSRNNTPGSAFKNVGHVDYAFLSVEPREAAAISPPLKRESRFGNSCYVVDFAAVPDGAIMTIGDLDTKNAKIGLSRIAHVFGESAAREARSRSEPKSVHEDGQKVEIQVRTFDTMSEQIFTKRDAPQALALLAYLEASSLGIDFNALDTEQFNTIVNAMYVPQIMVPHVLSSKSVTLFSGGVRR